jgi:hypothetical protein
MSLKRKKLLTLIAAVVLIAIAGSLACVERGWIREVGVRAVLSNLYSRPVQQAYATNFDELNPQIAQLGLKFGTGDSYNRDDSSCETFGYEHFSASYECMKHRYSNTPKLTDAYVANWEKQSPALEKYILDHGWKKMWNERQPIDQILRPNQDLSIGVNYQKSYGRITCTLSIIRFGGTQDIADDHLYADEICYRFIDVFGGY